MGKPQTFNQVILDAGSSKGDQARSYQVYVSNNGLTWGNPVAGGSSNVASSGSSTTFFTQVARYIRVVQTGTTGNWWSIAEFHAALVNAPTQGTLSRTGWQAAASSSASGQEMPIAALDNRMDTRWSSGYAQNDSQWFQVDMRGMKVFNQVTLDAGPSVGDQPRNYQVFVSNDAQNWGNPVAGGAAAEQVTSVTFAPQEARFIRIAQTGSSGSWWSIAEFNAALVPMPTQASLPRNRWTGWASSSASSAEVPARAFDDNLATRWSTGTAQTSGQWFMIDMGTTQLVNRLVMYTGTTAEDQPRDFSVYVSADGHTWGAPVIRGNGSGPTTDIRFAPQTARYVMITQNGWSGNWWSIGDMMLMH
jgi:endo-1,3(4)-beta-glucanase